MNDQTRWRTDDAAPLQGKVTLEPAPSMASEAKPPAPARRLEEESFEPLDALDELTEVFRTATRLEIDFWQQALDSTG